MSFKSYSDFLYQFDATAINDLNSPTGQLSIEVWSDATTYDNILNYAEPVVNIIDNKEITWLFKQNDQSPYNYKPTTEASYVYTLDDVYYLAGIDNVPSFFSMSMPLSPIDNTVAFDIPFNGGNFVSAEIVNLDLQQKIYSQYSSYNNYLIYPNFPITNYLSLNKFTKNLTQILQTDSTIDYDLITTTPTGVPTLNINFKYGIIFDNSLVGYAPSNQFKYDAHVSSRPKCTNISQDVIKSDYIYETDYKINGFVVLDTNITDVTNILNFNDSTITIENEDYYINRQHVPPPRYLSYYKFYNI